nr:reverse transcriptase domain-containing protein [Tanacetum cinerariifolium]
MCDVPFRDNSLPLGVSKDQFEEFFDSNDEFSSIDDDSFSIDNIEYVEASPPDSELVSSEVMEIVILEVGGIDNDILLTIKDDILCEKLLNVNLLIAKIEALNDNPTPSSVFKTMSSSTSLNSLLEETNNFDNSLPELKTFCFDVEEISSGSTTTHSDISHPEYELFYENHVKEISSGKIKNKLVPTITPLIRFSGEAWSQEVASGSVNRSQNAEDPCRRRNNHLKSSMLVPFECAMVSGPEGSLSVTKLIVEERNKVAINLEHSKQNVMIGSTLTEEGHNRLCNLLQRNLDIFAWKPADMTGIPRHITEHRLNVREGCSSLLSYALGVENHYMVFHLVNGVVTPSLSTEEPDNSLCMGDEHLDTIPATESDEFIKSSVENLIPILSESEGILKNMCDVPFHDSSLPLDVSKDQFEEFFDSNDEFSSIDDDSFSIDNIDYVEASPPDSELVSSEVMEIVILEVGGIDNDILLTIKDDILCEKLLNVNLLIANIEALNDNPTPSSVFKTMYSSTSLNSLLEETNNFDNSLPELKTFCFDVEEISSGRTTTHSDISLPEYELFYENHVKEISSGSTTTHSNSPLYDSFIFNLSINPLTPADRSDFYEFADELIHFISPPEYDCFLFKIEPNSGDFTVDVVEDISCWDFTLRDDIDGITISYHSLIHKG